MGETGGCARALTQEDPWHGVTWRVPKPQRSTTVVCTRCYALRNYGKVAADTERLMPTFDFEQVWRSQQWCQAQAEDQGARCRVALVCSVQRGGSSLPVSPRSRGISTKVGVDSALRNECKGGFTTPKHIHGG